MNVILESEDDIYIDKYEEIEILKNKSISNKIKRIGTMRAIQ